MTARTMLDKIAAVHGAHNAFDLASVTGLTISEISKIRHTALRGAKMTLMTLRQVSVQSGIPISTLADWWAEPEPFKEKHNAKTHSHSAVGSWHVPGPGRS